MSAKELGETRTTELYNGLQSSFLEALDEDEKLRIFDLTTRASRELHRWAALYPLIRRMRVWPLSLSVAAAAPFAPVAALVTMARMNLWVFTIDDLFDEEIVPFPELQRRVAHYKEILSGGRVEPKRERDRLLGALQDIRDDLSTYALFPAFQPFWAEAVSGTMESMLREHEWRLLYRNGDGNYALPSYDTYLNDALYSIGGPPHIWTALIAIGDASAQQHLDRLREMERTASICIRLANDLQSHQKEVAEGKVNSVIIRQREALAEGLDPDAALFFAREAVRDDIRRRLDRCIELKNTAETATGYPERAIADIARFACDFYVHHDYHTFAAGAGRT